MSEPQSWKSRKKKKRCESQSTPLDHIVSTSTNALHRSPPSSLRLRCRFVLHSSAPLARCRPTCAAATCRATLTVPAISIVMAFDARYYKMEISCCRKLLCIVSSRCRSDSSVPRTRRGRAAARSARHRDAPRYSPSSRGVRRLWNARTWSRGDRLVRVPHALCVLRTTFASRAITPPRQQRRLLAIFSRYCTIDRDHQCRRIF